MTRHRSLLFAHVWKAAGTSLHEAFARILPGYTVASAENRVPASVWLGRYPGVGGHFLREHFGGSLGHDEVLSCTVLREPVERALSHFHFNRQYNSELASAANTETALAEVLDGIQTDTESFHLLSNVQTSIFAGPARASRDPGERLDAAKHTLASFTIVGVTEELPRFLARVCAAFGASPPPLPFLNTNTAPARTAPIEPLLRARLREVNALDLQLHAFARELAARAPAVATPDRPSDLPCPAPSLAPVVGIRFGSRTSEFAVIDAALHQTANEIPELEIRCVIRGEASGPVEVGLRIVDAFGFTVFGTTAGAMGKPVTLSRQIDRHLHFTLRLPLAPGRYALDLSLNSEFSVLDAVNEARAFTIPPWSGRLFVGHTRLDCSVD